MPDTCPFCSPADDRIWWEDEIACVLWDAFPISNGHALVIPKQHSASLYDLSEATQVSLWKVVAEVRRRLLNRLDPDGFNVGVNDGLAAGQTVMHVHIHVIPRWENDVSDPRGGIRWIIPNKARYW